MAEPDNHTLRLLREIREHIARLENKLDGSANTLGRKIDSNHAEVTDRLDRLRQAMAGESVSAGTPPPKSTNGLTRLKGA
jgi:hypothetical protein